MKCAILFLLAIFCFDLFAKLYFVSSLNLEVVTYLWCSGVFFSISAVFVMQSAFLAESLVSIALTLKQSGQHSLF